MESSQASFVCGVVLAVLATICCILAFSLPSWIYTYEDDSNQGIDYAGLWTFCLETFFDYRNRAGRPCDNLQRGSSSCLFNDGVPMYGCHWIYSDELKEIRWTILNPAWYIAVQIMATVNLILTLLGMIALFVILFVRKNKCLLIFSIVSMFFCCGLGLCEVVLYALRVTDDEYYKVPNVRAKSLGAGWGLAVVAFILSGFAMIALTASYVNGKEKKYIKAARRDQNRPPVYDY